MDGNEADSNCQVVRRNSVVKNHRKINVDHLNYLRLWERILNKKKNIVVENDETLESAIDEEKNENLYFSGKKDETTGMKCDDKNKCLPEIKQNKKSNKPRIVGVLSTTMGSSMSSSVGDRRTNALRRSQRKTLTGACSNIDKVLKALKSYKGVEDSEEYKNMKIRIIQIEKNLQNKLAEPQQQFRTLHEITRQKIKTAFETLEEKTAENTRSRGIIPNGNGTKPPSPNTRRTTEDLGRQEESEKNPIPAQSPTNENKRNSLLLRMSKFTLPKRESKSSECEVQEVQAEVHKSPEATRKSIMKYGVPVLPGPPHNSPPKLVSFNTPDPFEDALLRHERRLKMIKQDIANLEIRISEFVGKKDGKHYNNLKVSLERLGEELEGMREEELSDQVEMCRNYVKSCLNFLESKALDEEDVDDDVFTNYTDSKIYGSTHDLLEGHNVRTTAI